MYGSIAVVRQLFEKADIAAISDADVTACIGRADNLIDGYLRGFFTVPFTTTPDLIADASNYIATSYAIRQKYPSQQKTMLEFSKAHYKDGYNIIKMIRRGQLNLSTTYPRLTIITSSTDEDDNIFETDTQH